ncbi:NACHT domain-containing protein [Nonomuraea solani]|uniref:NACHT domain-containing protein n=1 Tax=Nonomuraea solani TaxID=1144553 RepID=A0A1H6EVK2_9ACTN|nr:NACHT domain-containing protein [Nonomuraea solani]SEH00879.1 NACHT domain-containing protein [Nonomuraea solani]
MSARYWQHRNAGNRVMTWGVVLLVVACGGAYVVYQGKLGTEVAIGVFGALIGGAWMVGEKVAPLLSWWHKRGAPVRGPTPTDIDTAKDILAGLVAQQWYDEMALRSLGDPAPMPLPWRSTERRELVDHPEIIAEGSVAFPGLAVHIADLARNFRALRCRRLVILGDPGTGKTTLAVQLVLELLRTRQPDEPVPVLLSAARWDNRAHPWLRDWLTASLTADYPALLAEGLGSDIPETLVARGEVLPVLDGLDELPDHARAAMLTALNRSMLDNHQLILTCRTAQFAAAVDEIGDVLTAAAVIEPQPMSPATAADYLKACLPPVPRPAWPPILEALRTGAAPALAEVASTSLGLWLVRATYIAPRADPSPLLELGRGSAAELHDHLCDHLIPALVSTHPPADGPVQPFRPRHAWPPEQVGQWLTYLSRQLSRDPDDPRDMAWWHLAHYTSSRSIRLGGGIVIGIVIGLVVALLTKLPQAGAPIGLLFALAVAILIGSWFTEPPGHADFHVRGRLHELLGVVRNGLVAAAIAALVSAPTVILMKKNLEMAWDAAWKSALLTGFGYFIVLGLARWVERPTLDAIARSPRSTWQADRNLTFVRILGGLGIGLLFGVIGWLTQLPWSMVIAGGLVLGLLLGLMLGRHHAWLAYKLTIFRLATKGRLPLRTMDFLDDAHRLGLLRTEGPYYQFRHAELQEHLARGPEAPSRQS